MDLRTVELLDDTQCSMWENMLVDLIYEFNANTTGYFDGRLMGGRLCTEAGELMGGFSGHTWGGISVITHLWVGQRFRGFGVGEALLTSAEQEAQRRHCVNAILMTHSFQAPGFYERLGYERVCTVEAWPIGHSNMVYRKSLAGCLGRCGQ